MKDRKEFTTNLNEQRKKIDIMLIIVDEQLKRRILLSNHEN